MSATTTDADYEMPPVPAEKHRRLPYAVRMFIAIVAGVLGLGIAVGFGGYVLNSHFQQDTIAQQAAQLQAVQNSGDCKSQLTADAEAQLFRSTVVLLDTVERLANRGSVDVAEIDTAKTQLATAAAAREQVVAACQAIAAAGVTVPTGTTTTPPTAPNIATTTQETP
jgi:hypothetical protein